MAKQKQLSKELLAALASGGTLSADLQAQHDAAAAAEAADESAVTAAAVAAAAKTDPPAVETAAVVVPPVVATDPPAASTVGTLAATVDASASLVAHLKEELTGVRGELTTLQVKASTAETRVTTLEAENTAMLGIVRTAAERLCVALNASTAGVAAMPATALCAHFTQLNADFAKKYTVGAKATPDADNPAANGKMKLENGAVEGANADPMLLAGARAATPAAAKKK
jgi:hypothetical protein